MIEDSSVCREHDRHVAVKGSRTQVEGTTPGQMKLECKVWQFPKLWCLDALLVALVVAQATKCLGICWAVI